MWEFEWGSKGKINVILASPDRYPKGTKLGILSWEEHCTECAVPECYLSCSLYRRRIDGACSRFENNIQWVGYRARASALIEFKQWGKLESEIPYRFVNARLHSSINRTHDFSAILISAIPFQSLRGLLGKALPRLRRRMLRLFGRKYPLRSTKVLNSTVYNPGNPTSISIEISNLGISVFRSVLTIPAGWASSSIMLPSTLPGSLIRLYPDPKIPTALLFHSLDLVIQQPVQDDVVLDFKSPENLIRENQSPSQIKCVVWDLDGTIWDGVLIESGETPITAIKSGIKEILKSLDDRGVLNSVASKNSFEEAIALLKKLEIDHFFVSPQISWGNKSASISQISKSLNLDIRDFLFIDDSQFELDEVKGTHPQINTLLASQIELVLDMPNLNSPFSVLGQNRRKLYQQENIRKQAESHSSLVYADFLKSCKMNLFFRNLTNEQDLERAFELLNRSNQLNLSGIRIDRKNLELEVLDSNNLWICGELEDIYGSHGVILVSKLSFEPELSIAELAISCRVAGKYVEEAFFQWVIDRFSSSTNFLYLNYVKTQRNALMNVAIDRTGFFQDRISKNYLIKVPAEIIDSRIVSVFSDLRNMEG